MSVAYVVLLGVVGAWGTYSWQRSRRLWVACAVALILVLVTAAAVVEPDIEGWAILAGVPASIVGQFVANRWLLPAGRA